MIQIVIFDVDGTLINGNCTYFFMRYLFENDLIRSEHFNAFNKKFNRYLKSDGQYRDIIAESIRTFSLIGIDQFKYHWKQCFDKRIKMNFNETIVNQLKESQQKNLEIVLASGSYKELISLVGRELNVKPENIIASESGSKDQTDDSASEELICYGGAKMKRIIEFLHSKGANLDNVLFFTDNISDQSLLSAVGKGCWVGGSEAYSEYLMDKKGIEYFKAPILNSGSDSNKGLKFTKSLRNYYNNHLPLIEQSISEILPEKCTDISMDNLVGPIDLTWDLNTLQRSFFTPAYKYIKNKKEKIISLGSCLFMEAAEIDIQKFIPLIGIGDLLKISEEMFLDVKEWTNEENIQYWHKSRVNNAIFGNVAIALLSLVTNNVIFDRIIIDNQRKSELYEALTSVIFYELFGNGLKLFWEKQNEIRISEEEYFKVTSLTSRSPLQIPCDLWKILRKERLEKEETDALNSFAEKMTIAMQLDKDLKSFDLWQRHLPQTKTNKYIKSINYINIFTVNYFNDPSLFVKNTSVERMSDVINKAGSVSYIRQKSAKLKDEAFTLLESLPIKSNYKKLIKHYTSCLVNQS